MAEKESTINDQVEAKVKSIVIDSEYTTGIANNDFSDGEFQEILDLFECERTAKNADWRSDIFIPEFFSIIITQASTDASQYFQNRDFVETYVSDGTKTEEANADERLINRTLNQKHLHMYQKYMRRKMIQYLKGEGYARLWWERKTKPLTRSEKRLRHSDEVDIFGEELIEGATPKVIEEDIEVEDEEIIYDRFNYDVIDPRNVFTDNSYVYTLQEKPYFIIRSETDLDTLRSEEDDNDYFNLDKLEKKGDSGDTETSRATTNKDANQAKADKTPIKNFDKLERFGKFWVVVKETEDDGYPSKVEPAVDKDGKKHKDAEFIECLITFVKSSSDTVMIGFEAQRCRDANGIPYRPIIRGLQYIHPTNDTGIGDGKASKELQVAMNDTFNINNDRQMLAAIPVLKAKKYGNEENSTIRIEPEHVMELEDPNDVTELIINDNIQGSHIQISFLKGMMEQSAAQSPSTMGQLPQDSSVTATAIAGADARSNTRNNYKSLTDENTFDSEFYWMISQLTWQYADEETAIKLLGDKIMDFDPDGDYFWKPVSASIETEYSRNNKIKQLTNMIGLVVPLQNPKTAGLVNLMVAKAFSLMGDENDVFAKALLDPNAPIEGGRQVGQQEQAVSNQSGLPQSNIEEGAREATV